MPSAGFQADNVAPDEVNGCLQPGQMRSPGTTCLRASSSCLSSVVVNSPMRHLYHGLGRLTGVHRLLAAIVLLAGCRETLPAYTVTVPVRVEEVAPPAPSVVFAQATVPLDRLQRAVADALPPSLDKEWSSGTVRFAVALTRQPAVVRGDPQGLRIEVAELGQVDAHAGPIKCKSKDAGFRIALVGRPALTPGGTLRLADLRLEPVPLAPLSCNGIPVPLGALLEPATRELGTLLAKGLEKLELPVGVIVDQALDELNQPRAIDVAGAAACLVLDPRALVTGPVRGEGASVTVAIGAEVAPRVVLGNCPAATPRPARQARETPLGDAFSVEVVVAVATAQLQQVLSGALVGRRFGEGRHITVRRVTVGDAAGRVLVKLDVDGALEGALYLWGTPEVVARNGRFVVEVPDLQVAAETESVTAQIALWLWKQRDGGLPAEVRKRCVFDVTDRVEAARRALDRTFKPSLSPLALTVKIDRIEPGAVLSQPGALSVHARLVGRAELR